MEEWRDIKGFEGYYQVSNLGNVRSVDRTIVYKDGHKVFYAGKMMAKRINKKHGYVNVGLMKDNKSYAKNIHAIVAEAFIGERHGMDVNHKDGDKTNNRVENLEYVSHKENCVHRSKVLGITTCKRVKVKCLTTGTTYPSYTAAALANDVSLQCIWLAVKNGYAIRKNNTKWALA